MSSTIELRFLGRAVRFEPSGEEEWTVEQEGLDIPGRAACSNELIWLGPP